MPRPPSRPPSPATWRSATNAGVTDARTGGGPLPTQADPSAVGPERTRPIVGITADLDEPKPGRVRATCSVAYVAAVAAAGGTPVVLLPMRELIPQYLALCDGFVLTGGDDPRTEPFGEPTHPKTTPVHPERQAFETALLAELTARPQAPVLGVCLGMQMMALVAGGRLDQHLPDTVATADAHSANITHPVEPVALPEGAPANSIPRGEVTSHHHQAVADPGRLRIIAKAPDGVIEAIDDPSRRFYLGVQWHPERTADAALGAQLFARLVAAAGRTAR
ncbi:MAG: gamma-glutamyl-gamma-aminobutyrate hydrolase family protein [Phycisphaerales bacterium]|nr:gamma-glutamyl-gamma-aminobutyrate hydrolase family protein [Phycisphaerales bacterium]